ncbi:MAG: aromatic amino acid lyase [Eubacteriales bacterium]
MQDAYSIRCIPQIHGASRDAVRYVCKQSPGRSTPSPTIR